MATSASPNVDGNQHKKRARIIIQCLSSRITYISTILKSRCDDVADCQLSETSEGGEDEQLSECAHITACSGDGCVEEPSGDGPDEKTNETPDETPDRTPPTEAPDEIPDEINDETTAETTDGMPSTEAPDETQFTEEPTTDLPPIPTKTPTFSTEPPKNGAEMPSNTEASTDDPIISTDDPSPSTQTQTSTTLEGGALSTDSPEPSTEATIEEEDGSEVLTVFEDGAIPPIDEDTLRESTKARQPKNASDKDGVVRPSSASLLSDLLNSLYEEEKQQKAKNSEEYVYVNHLSGPKHIYI